jgi:hypothetical protein
MSKGSEKANGKYQVRGHPDLVSAQEKQYALEAQHEAAQQEYSAAAERVRLGIDTEAVNALLAGGAPDYTADDLGALSRKVRATGQAAAVARKDAEAVRVRLVQAASDKALPVYRAIVDRVYAAAKALVVAAAEESDFAAQLAAAGVPNPAGWSRVSPHYTASDLEGLKERIYRSLRRYDAEGGA